MRISCPHCRTIYEVATAEPDIHFLCARCHNEFFVEDPLKKDAHDSQHVPESDIQLGLFETNASIHPFTRFDQLPNGSLVRPPLFLEQLNPKENEEPSEPDFAEDEGLLAESISQESLVQDTPGRDKHIENDEPSPVPSSPMNAQVWPENDALPIPNRYAPRILTWLSWFMLVFAIAGFAYNHSSWSENLWFRSVMLNLHIPIRIHPSDWRIPPKSVHSEWIRRDNGSSVLVIEGKIDNRLHAEVPLPYVQVTVYDALHSDKTVRRKTLAITLPPSVDAIEHAPWVRPPNDTAPVAASGSRGFALVLDDLPKQAGEFTLDVIPSRFN